jgi:predicted metal-binding protein
MATAYGMKAPPSTADIAEISEVWKPYRTWVALLLRVMLEDETHEIGSRRIGSRAVLNEAAVESRTANRRDSAVPTLSLQRAPALS